MALAGSLNEITFLKNFSNAKPLHTAKADTENPTANRDSKWLGMIPMSISRLDIENRGM